MSSNYKVDGACNRCNFLLDDGFTKWPEIIVLVRWHGVSFVNFTNRKVLLLPNCVKMRRTWFNMAWRDVFDSMCSIYSKKKIKSTNDVAM